MAEQALHIVLSVLLYNMHYIEASSSTYQHIQVGGPANKITTGEIRIDLPSESFQNIKFNITPYSLQNEYSPYYDQYRPGFKQASAYSLPKTQTYKPVPSKPTLQPAYKSPRKLIYKPTTLELYKPSSSVPKPPKVSYAQPKVSYSRPSYTQPKLSSSPVESVTQAYSRYIPADLQPVQGYYSAYPYPYQNSQYRKHTTEEDRNVEVSAVDTKEETRNGNQKSPTIDTTSVIIDDKSGISEGHGTLDQSDIILDTNVKIMDGNENTPIIDTTPGIRDEKSGISEEKVSLDESDILIEEVFTSPNLGEKSNQDIEKQVERKPKRFDQDIDIFKLNSVDFDGSTTLLPNLVSTTVTNTLTTSLVTSPPATTPPPIKSTVTSKILSTASLTRRRPVISFFRDLVSFTENVTPPGEIGQHILDRMRTATLSAETLLDSDEQTDNESTVTPTIDINLDEVVVEKDQKEEETTNEENKEIEISNAGNEKKARKERQIPNLGESKTYNLNQVSQYSYHWRNGRWF